MKQIELEFSFKKKTGAEVSLKNIENLPKELKSDENNQ